MFAGGLGCRLGFGLVGNLSSIRGHLGSKLSAKSCCGTDSRHPHRCQRQHQLAATAPKQNKCGSIAEAAQAAAAAKAAAAASSATRRIAAASYAAGYAIAAAAVAAIRRRCGGGGSGSVASGSGSGAAAADDTDSGDLTAAPTPATTPAPTPALSRTAAPLAVGTGTDSRHQLRHRRQPWQGQ
jgi:hypothetical protein